MTDTTNPAVTLLRGVASAAALVVLLHREHDLPWVGTAAAVALGVVASSVAVVGFQAARDAWSRRRGAEAFAVRLADTRIVAARASHGLSCRGERWTRNTVSLCSECGPDRESAFVLFR